MKTGIKNYFRAGVAALAVVSLAACGTAAEGQQTLVIADVSGSGRSEAANLVATAADIATSALNALKPGDVVTVYGFAYRPGTPCEAIRVELADGNSEEVASQRRSLVSGFASAWDAYTACLTSEEYGTSGSGSAIFGAIPSALVEAEGGPGISTITLVTDGCVAGETGQTCGRGSNDPDFARKYVDSLPSALTPDLAGIDLVVVGLGDGTLLQAADIARVQDVFEVYANATSADSVTFR